MCAAGATAINQLAESGPLLKIPTFDNQERGGGQEYARVGIKRGRQWCLVSFDVPP